VTTHIRKTLPIIFEENGDKVYSIRRIREHLVDWERSEPIYLVIRDHEKSLIYISLYLRVGLEPPE